MNRRTRRTSSELVDLEGTWRKLGGYYGETRRELEENYIGGRTIKEQGRNKERPRRELGAGTTRRGEGAPVYLTELEAACQIPNHQFI